jgi:hypothetical protein
LVPNAGSDTQVLGLREVLRISAPTGKLSSKRISVVATAGSAGFWLAGSVYVTVCTAASNAFSALASIWVAAAKVWDWAGVGSFRKGGVLAMFLSIAESAPL